MRWYNAIASGTSQLSALAILRKNCCGVSSTLRVCGWRNR